MIADLHRRRRRRRVYRDLHLPQEVEQNRAEQSRAERLIASPAEHARRCAPPRA